MLLGIALSTLCQGIRDKIQSAQRSQEWLVITSKKKTSPEIQMSSLVPRKISSNVANLLQRRKQCEEGGRKRNKSREGFVF